MYDVDSVHLMFFSAAWSSPGSLMAPMVKRIARKYRIPLTLLDVDEQPGLVRTHGLRHMPTLMLVHGDRVLRRWDGLHPEMAIRHGLEECLGRSEHDLLST